MTLRGRCEPTGSPAPRVTDIRRLATNAPIRRLDARKCDWTAGLLRARLDESGVSERRAELKA